MKTKVRNAKRSMEKRLAYVRDGNKARIFANYIKSKTKSKIGIGPLKVNDGTIITDDAQLARILNEFFSSVFSTEDTVNIPTVGVESEERLTKINLQTSKIVAKIKELKEKSAPGPDGISPQLLKIAPRAIAEGLRIIYQKSLQHGEVPTDWKHAKVILIYKKGC